MTTTRLRLITADDVSAMTGFTANTIRRMARRGDIPCRRLGQRVRFVPDEVEQWLTGLPAGGAR
jgi:excisionase family DNA binding protein